MSTRLAVLHRMKSNSTYTVNDLYGATDFTKGQIRSSLRSLFKGGLVSREKQGKSFEYKSKQCELSLES